MSALSRGDLSADHQSVMDRHAKSFSWAARFLNASARPEVALLYAFARTADDLADEEEFGTLLERYAALQHMHNSALGLASPLGPNAEFGLALRAGAMLRGHGVASGVLERFMDALKEDTQARQIETEDELLDFAYGVAGTVGQMMRPLLGADTVAEPYAIALGIAMQLTNIARDIVEDGYRQRCYIPRQWGVTLQMMVTPADTEEKLRAFSAIERLIALSEGYYNYASKGFRMIPVRNRCAVLAAAALYKGIGRKILRQGGETYWHGRTYLTKMEKVKTVFFALVIGSPQPSTIEPEGFFGGTELLHRVQGFSSAK